MKVKESYLLGLPLLFPSSQLERKEYYAPAGQARLCWNIIAKTNDLETVRDGLLREFVSIAAGMLRMGIEFRICVGAGKGVDGLALASCISLGAKLVSFGDGYLPGMLAYPRDMFMIAGNVALVSPRGVVLTGSGNHEVRLVSSLLGEGGRTLVAGNKAIVPERLVMQDKESIWLPDTELRTLRDSGLEVVTIPQVVASVFTKEGGITDRCFGNDHLDRSNCLVKGKDGRVHLITEPLIFLVKWTDRKRLQWEPMDPEESWQLLNKACDSIGVVCHRPQQPLRVPYSLNLMQFFNERILMTAGEPEVSDMLGGIVGQDKIFETSVPIVHYPTWTQAGIHCLITDAPPIFKKIG